MSYNDLAIAMMIGVCMRKFMIVVRGFSNAALALYTQASALAPVSMHDTHQRRTRR